ncbi:zinc finger protein [Schizosaccharomyces japonicus yFS275]|uniref:Zinc finger protein n=1 Tax=Schizosaccharomyces japonicus (strain yFS275 / FY16936) TaxID=402676 RepID=B6K088_SCHJY|nr:zinc finger protein [Schizosaccharomyces japonicus yFS275]EEB06238.1 zinc finger protein [Schizosaccharomyces japonicus yFS275]
MGRVGRKRKHHNNGNHALFRTREYGRDLDQIQDDLKEPEKFQSLPLDPDLPGLGQHYCIECARHFESDHSLREHRRSKIHKRRLKQLQEVPYTQEEAEAAVGIVRKPAVSSEKVAVEAKSENVVMAD